MKVAWIILAIFFVGICLGLAIRYNQNASHAIKDLQDERYLRMTAEESLDRANGKISSLEYQVNEVIEKSQTAQKDFEALRASADEYRGRLDKAAETNKSLEEKIKELQNTVAPAPVAANPAPTQ